MTRSLTRQQSAVLGFVVVACLAIGVWGLFRVTGKSGMWRDGYELTVVAADAQDVEPGTTVRVRGVEAGRVVGVDYADDEVLINVRLDGKFRDKIYADSMAMVQTKGVLGVSVVDIKPGTSQSGPLAEPVIHARPAPDLAEVTAKLSSVATRVDTVLKEVQEGNGTLPKLLKDDAIYKDLKTASADTKSLVKNLDETTTALRGDAQRTLNGVNESVEAVRGELGEIKTFARNGQEAAVAIKQDAEAVKAMPIVRSYVEDHVATLVRPNCDRERVVYSSDEFFEAGTAILTDSGRTRLNECAAWLNWQHQKNSEVVVASFADPKSGVLTAPGARVLTKKQAEAVAEYLKDRGVHKMGYITRRKITPVGHGFDPSPVVEKDPLPTTRIEVILFIPR
ncbi:MAG TPA: MlaD family protein [Gemmataceae bacterium]|nr:MlaD family protein [Gemmataceae bacterium]